MRYQEEVEKAQRAVSWGLNIVKKRRQGKEFSLWCGKNRAYYNSLGQSKDPALSGAFLLSRFLNMSFAEFMEQALNSEDEERDDELSEPKSPPSICTEALKRAAVAPRKKGNYDMCDPLEYLDDVRYTDPAGALLGLSTLVRELPAEQIPYALHVAASCFRVLEELKDAAYCLSIAEEIAKSTENFFAIGDNLQRWVYVYTSAGYRHSALEKAKEAHGIFTENGHARKIGETVVDRALCLFYLNEFTRALSTYDSALKIYFDYLRPRHKISVYQGKAHVLLKMGETEGAKRLCEAALNETGNHSSNARGKSLWLISRIEKSLGNSGPAFDAARRAAENLKVSSPIDSLVIGLEALADVGPEANTFFDLLAGDIAPTIKARLPAMCSLIEDCLALTKCQRSVEQVLQIKAQVEAFKIRYLGSSRAATPLGSKMGPALLGPSGVG